MKLVKLKIIHMQSGGTALLDRAVQPKEPAGFITLWMLPARGER